MFCFYVFILHKNLGEANVSRYPFLLPAWFKIYSNLYIYLIHILQTGLIFNFKKSLGCTETQNCCTTTEVEAHRNNFGNSKSTFNWFGFKFKLMKWRPDSSKEIDKLEVLFDCQVWSLDDQDFWLYLDKPALTAVVEVIAEGENKRLLYWHSFPNIWWI